MVKIIKVEIEINWVIEPTLCQFHSLKTESSRLLFHLCRRSVENFGPVPFVMSETCIHDNKHIVIQNSIEIHFLEFTGTILDSIILFYHPIYYNCATVKAIVVE